MTATIKSTKTTWTDERISILSVGLLTLAALLLGWWLKTAVENRSHEFSAGAVTAQIPVGWLQMSPVGSEILHLTDRTASGYGTTYIIQTQAVAADADPAQVAGLLTLARGTELTAYRVLNQEEVLVQGKSAVEIEYVFVDSPANLGRAVIPTVVRGLDYIFVNAGQEIVVSYRADESIFDIDLGRFYRFLLSVKF